MKYLVIIAVALTAFTSCTQAQNQKNQYTITVDQADLRKVKVEGIINLSQPKLSMDWPSANSVERGWAHFVENLKVYDSKNRPIDIEYQNKATWKLNAKEDRVRISYEVNVTHDKVNWTEGGHSASAYVVNDVVYMIGAALFIAEPKELAMGNGQQSTVTFDLPEDFNVAVPWSTTAGKTNEFEANSIYELVRSGMQFGRFEKSTTNIGGMEIEIATAADFKEVIPIFQSIYQQIIPATLDYFGDKTASKYLVIANQAPRTEEFQPYFSGEALHQSMSVISPVVPSQEFMPVFWYLLSHEYVHIWNGINIQVSDQEAENWFMEGFTDHISWDILHRIGIIPSDVMINGLSVAGNSAGWGVNIQKYLAVAGEKTMREAGKAKQENYDLLYSGGSLFALILDIEMNHVSDGQAGVRALMRTLNQKFGVAQDGRQISFDDIKKTVNDLSGKNLDELFDAYVNGSTVIPVSDYLQKAGLLIQNIGAESQQITLDENATAKQKLVLKAISGISL